MISGSDITFVLSGGSLNSDPLQSIGGDPSNQIILPGIDNLFNDITPEQAISGYTDYRCAYVFNNNSVDSFYHSTTFLANQISGGSTIQIGVLNLLDIQKITLIGIPSSGDFQIKYNAGYVTPTLTINYDSDVDAFAANLQSQLDTIPQITGTTVTGLLSGSSTIFTIVFSGEGQNRYHDPITLIANNLVGTTDINILKTQNGSPINSIASLLDFPTSVPFGVIFGSYSSASPISIGTMLPLDGVPIWLKRTTPVNSAAVLNDAVTFSFRGNPLL